MINKRLSESQKHEIFTQVVETIQMANNVYAQDMEIPMVEFKKLGRTAGYAMPIKWMVQYNDTLAAENFEEFKQTVIHEVAHLVDYHLHGVQRSYNGRRVVHGKTFKQIMVRLGAKPDTYHSYDTTSVERKSGSRNKYVWVNTAGQEMKLGVIRHNRMVAGTGRYWMKNHSCREYSYTTTTVRRI